MKYFNQKMVYIANKSKVNTSKPLVVREIKKLVFCKE